MTALGIIANLAVRRYELEAVGELVVIRGPLPIPQDIVQLVRDHKPALLENLNCRSVLGSDRLLKFTLEDTPFINALWMLGWPAKVMERLTVAKARRIVADGKQYFTLVNLNREGKDAA